MYSVHLSTETKMSYVLLYSLIWGCSRIYAL
nr:MAG TPA: hypothetical protein [Caudoviricetes sp.]